MDEWEFTEYETGVPDRGQITVMMVDYNYFFIRLYLLPRCMHPEVREWVLLTFFSLPESHCVSKRAQWIFIEWMPEWMLGGVGSYFSPGWWADCPPSRQFVWTLPLGEYRAIKQNDLKLSVFEEVPLAITWQIHWERLEVGRPVRRLL